LVQFEVGRLNAPKAPTHYVISAKAEIQQGEVRGRTVLLN